MVTYFTKGKLFSTMTYEMRNTLHAGYIFPNTEGLVNYLLQDHCIGTEKAADSTQLHM